MNNDELLRIAHECTLIAKEAWLKEFNDTPYRGDTAQYPIGRLASKLLVYKLNLNGEGI